MAEPAGDPPAPEGGENPEQPSQGAPTEQDPEAAAPPGEDELGEAHAPDQEVRRPSQEQPPARVPSQTLRDSTEPRGAIYQPPQVQGALFQGRSGSQPAVESQSRPSLPSSTVRGSTHSMEKGKLSRGASSTTMTKTTPSQHQYEPGHGPYQTHEPGYGLYQTGTNLYEDQVPDPGPRELAIKNAKAYLLKTSVKTGVSL